MEADPPPDSLDRVRFQEEYDAGRFASAFAAFQSGHLKRAISVLEQENLTTEWLKRPTSALELAGGLVAALDRLIEREGEYASYKLEVARDAAEAVATMQQLLNAGLKVDGLTTADALGRLLLQAVRLGVTETITGQTLGGMLDQFGQLKWEEAKTREDRGKGARAVNAGKAQRRQDALAVARDICATNPTLTNDELAFRIRERSRIAMAVKTITDWVRTWRRRGDLPPRRT